MVREAARRTACLNNIRQIGLGLMNYESSYETFPPGWTSEDVAVPVGEPGWGWSAEILPYMEAENLQDRLDFDFAIDAPAHAEWIQTSLPFYLCPSDPGEEIVNLNDHIEDHDHDDFSGADDDDDDDHHEDGELWVSRSNYSGVFGTTELDDGPTNGNGAFLANRAIRLRDFTDGLSHTLIVGERRSDRGSVSWVGVVPWVDSPCARIVGVACHAPNDEHGHWEDFSSFHPAGINVVLGDGSAHFVRESIDEMVFKALATRSGRELVSIDD
ncbi:MAG: DUF1559 domain-containing protein [Mariniblastus sp.]|nr:DUF1559 domain-containing protein [Mariniblastus sp.]